MIHMRASVSMADDKKVIVVFEAAVIQMATITATTQTAAKALVTEKAIIALAAKTVANQSRKMVREDAQYFYVTAPLLFLSSLNEKTSFNNEWRAIKAVS